MRFPLAAGCMELHRRQFQRFTFSVFPMPPSPFRLCAFSALLLGWVVTLAAAPSARVVSQTVGTDELLLAVAAPEQIAALSHLARDPDYSALAREAAAFPQIAVGDAESILKHAPTLVLAADYSRAELIEQVRRAGVRVLIFDRYKTLEDAFNNLRRLATELGPEAVARAEAVIRDHRERLAQLQQKLKGRRPVRVICPSTYGVIGGADTTFQDLCDHAGAENLATSLGGLRGHEPPPSERLLTWPIEKVVLAGATRDEALAPFRKLSPYQFLPAIKEGRVALIEPYMLSSVSHFRVAGYERLARELHPEVFR